MQTVFWILLCIAAFILVIELFGRLFYGYCPPKKVARGFWVVALSNDASALREQLEYYLSWIEWNAPGHQVVFVRDEQNTAADELFWRYLGDVPDARLVTERQLSALLRQ